MIKNERGFPIGIGILGLGATLAISYWIYTIQGASTTSFWRWPGYLGIALSMIGLLLIIFNFSRNTSEELQPRQTQIAGNSSSNIQVGRDLNIGDTNSE